LIDCFRADARADVVFGLQQCFQLFLGFRLDGIRGLRRRCRSGSGVDAGSGSAAGATALNADAAGMSFSKKLVQLSSGMSNSSVSSPAGGNGGCGSVGRTS